jgi:hypothetical protein
LEREARKPGRPGRCGDNGLHFVPRGREQLLVFATLKIQFPAFPGLGRAGIYIDWCIMHNGPIRIKIPPFDSALEIVLLRMSNVLLNNIVLFSFLYSAKMIPEC